MYSPEELLQFSTVENLTAHDITTRMSRGWSIEDALSKPKINKDIKFEYKGKMYTAKELACISSVENILPRDIFNRIVHYGWSVERAITQQKNTKLQPYGCRDANKECLFDYNGKTYKSFELSQISDVDGITSKDIVNRVKHSGWTIEEALTRPKKQRDQLFEYKGDMYTSKELAKLSPLENITHHDITDRINRNGWTVERAITQPKRKSPCKKNT